MNRATIRSLASKFCNDPNLTRFTATQYNEAIDIAEREFCLDSKALFKDAPTFTVVDGTATYSLPSDFWIEKEISHKGLKLTPITRHDLILGNGDDWTDDVGTPTHYIIDPEEARKQIRLYPIPQGDDAGANLIMTYYQIPTAMTGDSSTPFNSSTLMSQYHIAIAAYAAWLVLGYGQTTPDIQAKRADLIAQYNAKCVQAADTFGTTKSAPFRFKGING